MTKFVPLVRADGETILVNPDCIESVEPDFERDSAKIVFQGGGRAVIVQGTMEDLQAKLEGPAWRGLTP